MTDRHWFFGGLAVMALGVAAIVLFELWQRRKRNR